MPDPTIPSIHTLQKEFPQHFKRLKKKPAHIFFKMLDDEINSIIEDYRLTHTWLNILGKKEYGRVRKAILYYDFTDIHEVKNEYTTVLKIASLKNKLKHEVTRWYLKYNQLEKVGFFDYEKVMILYGMELSEIIDQIFIHWREEIKCSKAGKKIGILEEEGRGRGAQWLAYEHLENPYTLIQRVGNRWKEIPLAACFPTFYKKVDQILSQLTDQLQLCIATAEIKKIIEYFKKLKEAYAEININNLERKWYQVDVAWMQIKGRLQPIHAMEKSYVDPVSARVAPCFRIMYEDNSVKKLNKKNDQAKKTIETHLENFFKDYSSWQKTKHTIAGCTVKIYIPTTVSGMELEFLAVGQIAPNRSNVRRECGMKVFIDYDSMHDRHIQSKELFRKIFGSEITEQYYRVKTDDIITHLVTTHELCHSILRTEKAEKKLGSFITAHIDEVKAMWCGLLILKQRLENKEITNREYKQIIIGLIGAELRYVSLREEETLRAYYICALFWLKFLMQSGFLSLEKNDWKIDFTKIDTFHHFILEHLKQIADIYETCDSNKAQKFLGEARESKKIKNLLEYF